MICLKSLVNVNSTDSFKEVLKLVQKTLDMLILLPLCYVVECKLSYSVIPGMSCAASVKSTERRHTEWNFNKLRRSVVPRQKLNGLHWCHFYKKVFYSKTCSEETLGLIGSAQSVTRCAVS